jgi:hypothetical protein
MSVFYSFFFRGEYYGQGEVTPLLLGWQHSPSYSFLCPSCGEVWLKAKAEVRVDTIYSAKRFQGFHAVCPSCPPAPYDIPGVIPNHAPKLPWSVEVLRQQVIALAANTSVCP